MKISLAPIFKISIMIISFGILLILFLPARTPKYKGIERYANSVAKLEMVEIGGTKQSLLVRGTDIENPIILNLHGGPSYAQIGFARKYQKKLEKEFIVVNWDQRGSGKSYSFGTEKTTMTREQFIADTVEIIDYLCQEYSKEKVYLVGHSWGSDLGLHVVSQYPERILAYIGVGQVIDWKRGEEISYHYAYGVAKENEDHKALKVLDEIGPPPYGNMVKDISKQRKILNRYNGTELQVNTLKDTIYGCLFSPEYTGIDGIRYVIGSLFTANLMFEDVMDINLMDAIPSVEVPVYFAVGRQDHLTTPQLVEEYVAVLQAPYKEVIWFENSAHFPHFEEVEKFYDLMLSIKEKSH